VSFVSGDASVVARKRYRCWFCNQTIEVGERHLKRVGADEDGIWTMRMHPECEAATSNWDQDDYECHEPGEFKRPMTAFDPQI